MPGGRGKKQTSKKPPLYRKDGTTRSAQYTQRSGKYTLRNAQEHRSSDIMQNEKEGTEAGQTSHPSFFALFSVVRAGALLRFSFWPGNPWKALAQKRNPAGRWKHGIQGKRPFLSYSRVEAGTSRSAATRSGNVPGMYGALPGWYQHPSAPCGHGTPRHPRGGKARPGPESGQSAQPVQ